MGSCEMSNSIAGSSAGAMPSRLALRAALLAKFRTRFFSARSMDAMRRYSKMYERHKRPRNHAKCRNPKSIKHIRPVGCGAKAPTREREKERESEKTQPNYKLQISSFWNSVLTTHPCKPIKSRVHRFGPVCW